MGPGIAHEFDGGDLALLMQDALARQQQDRRRAESDRLLDFIATHCLYALPGSPAARGPESLAGFLGRFSLAPEGADVRAGRIDRFNAGSRLC